METSSSSVKMPGAICRHASQSMQVESTKKSPGTFSGRRKATLAMESVPSASADGSSGCSVFLFNDESRQSLVQVSSMLDAGFITSLPHAQSDFRRWLRPKSRAIFGGIYERLNHF